MVAKRGGAAAAGPAAEPATKTEVYSKKGGSPAAKSEDEDDEIPGTVKSYNTERRFLVVSLLNGQSTSFILSKDLKLLVKGVASEQGVADPALKAGAHVDVLVEPGTRRVRELHVDPVPPARTRTKKAA